MKEVTLSTGQVAQIRSKDELTEGQSREIEIARSRGSAVYARFAQPVYLKPNPDSTDAEPLPDVETFEVTGTRAREGTAQKTAIPKAVMDQFSDTDFANLRGFEDAAVRVLTVTLDGEPIGSPTTLLGDTFDALVNEVLEEYSGITVAPEGPDDKLNPLAAAAGSTESSSGAPT